MADTVLELQDRIRALEAELVELRKREEEQRLELSELRGAADAVLAYIDTSLPSGRELAFELGRLLRHGVDDLTKRLALSPRPEPERRDEEK